MNNRDYILTMYFKNIEHDDNIKLYKTFKFDDNGNINSYQTNKGNFIILNETEANNYFKNRIYKLWNSNDISLNNINEDIIKDCIDIEWFKNIYIYDINLYDDTSLYDIDYDIDYITWFINKYGYKYYSEIVKECNLLDLDKVCDILINNGERKKVIAKDDGIEREYVYNGIKYLIYRIDY